MENYDRDYREEKQYLEATLKFIKRELQREGRNLEARHGRLVDARREMWEQSVHFVNDFEKLVELNQHLAEVANQDAGYKNMKKQLDKYIRIVDSPYFGRFDFSEGGCSNAEKIYIGLYNVMDKDTYDVLVYDWRSPICSIFYRYEPGSVSYDAPKSRVFGDMLIKRQIKIKNSQLKYFIDCSVTITDEVLLEVLSRNSSPRMRNIVETIQREQDVIIRDTDNDLLIVQGAAGSGKTSIALHRIAFLLYQGINSNLNSNNIIIVSPNCIFSGYISSVLPELGEDNVDQITFDDIVQKLMEEIQDSRIMQLEHLILSQYEIEGRIRKKSIEFKGSNTFVEILDRLLRYNEHKVIRFKDVYYNNVMVYDRMELKNLFLNNKTGVPAVRRMKRIERIILDKIHPMQRIRLKRIEEIVKKDESHVYEIKPYSRLLSIKASRSLTEHIRSFTEIDYVELYKMLFNDRKLFDSLAEGLELPDETDKIIEYTKKSLDGGIFKLEDSIALLYLKLRLEGCGLFSEVRQVVIDEAQDYYPIQYQIFRMLFRDARYTVLGDINQSMEMGADKSVYDDIQQILDKRMNIKMFLNKSYRSSYEINEYTRNILGDAAGIASFERHEHEPEVIYKANRELADEAIAQDIKKLIFSGYESMAVICKTGQEAEEAYERLKELTPVSLISSEDMEVKKGATVIPAYLSKGLEFDGVIVYECSSHNYSTEFDRKLLYIACTRALHRLFLYYTGEKSPFI